jgi:antitoxin component YwqK of YwqJK toxin-antitoxin module
MTKHFLFGFLIFGILAYTACTNQKSSDTTVSMQKEVQAYFQDSIPKIIWEYPQGDSSQIKVSHYYHNQKLKMQGYLKNGVRNGKWIAWDEEGAMLSMGHYKDGFEEGMWTVWFPSGIKRYEGLFNAGKRIGKWKFWNAEGKLVKEIEY